MNSRRTCAVLALPAALALAACTSSTSGKGSTGSSSAPGTTTSSAPAGSSSSGASADAAALGRRMQAAVNKISSAHIELDLDVSGVAATGKGDEQLSGGKLVAMDVTENLPGTGAIRLIIVGGKVYAKLPAALNKSSKPYLLVTASSSNAVVKQLASSLGSALASASLGNFSPLAAAAKSVHVAGTETVGGVRTTHYSIVVDIAKLPADFPGKNSMTVGGLTSFPLELYLDAQGRPVQVMENLTVAGRHVATTVLVTDYNKPVTIKAPPASQVGTG